MPTADPPRRSLRLAQGGRDDRNEEWLYPDDMAEVWVFLASLPPKAAIDEAVVWRRAADLLV